MSGTRPRPDLPETHPQNVALRQWSTGWLLMECGSILGAEFLIARPEERAERGWPTDRDAMIELIRQTPSHGPADHDLKFG